eukprot:scaffold117640_cov18-Tisochrysis_lutea.AAC.1
MHCPLDAMHSRCASVAWRHAFRHPQHQRQQQQPHTCDTKCGRGCCKPGAAGCAPVTAGCSARPSVASRAGGGRKGLSDCSVGSSSERAAAASRAGGGMGKSGRGAGQE